MKTRPDIFAYHDYRVFLRDWLAHLKAGRSRVSLRGLAEESGLTVGYLSLVLSGKRPLSGKALGKLSGALRLKRTEVSYFKLLVVLGTSDLQEERMAALEGMKRFHSYQKRNAKEIEVYRYLTRWYYVAIREMCSLPGFQLDPVWIQSRLRVPPDLQEVKEAIDFLVANGYIERRADGSVVPPEKNLDCQGGVFRVALSQFHQDMFKLAAASIENTPNTERNLLGHAFAVDPRNLEEANRIVREAFEKVRALSPDPALCHSVYYVQFSLFPITGGADNGV